MTPGQWERVENLFEKGAAKPADERRALLEECVDDLVVQRQLEELWLHADAAPSFLTTPLAQLTETVEQRQLVGRLEAGRILAKRFTILDFLGAGGMGEVYRARDERLQRIVAIKVLPGRLAADLLYRKRLEREARAVSSLNHPGICAVHDLGTDGDHLYVVMEYVTGETLETKLARGPLPEHEAAGLALRIADSLRHAHENGIVHRDLKPANVMLSETGVKLLDFGIAARAGSAEPGSGPSTATLSLTGAGQIVGTFAYMSPEQAAGEQVDARSDVFSLGAVLFEMVTGRRAFPQGPVDLIEGHEIELIRRWPDVSPGLRRIIQRCLQKRAEHRYASIADFGSELRELLEGAAGPRRYRRWTAVATAAACIAAAGIWVARQGVSGPAEARLTPLTSYPGTEYSPSLSPDGRNVVFLWDGDNHDNFDLYVQAIGADKPLRLTTDPGSEKWPQWSPDGRWIAFTRDSAILLVSPFGGIERLVTHMAPSSGLGCENLLSWAPDSTHILYAAAANPAEPVAVQAASIDTGAVRRVTHPEPGSYGDWCPVVSPDGKLLLYTRRESDEREMRRHVASLGSGLTVTEDREVAWVTGWGHAWAATSRELIFPLDTAAGAFLHRISVERESPSQQLAYGEEGMYPAVARTGNRLVYMRRKSDIDVWEAVAGPSSARHEPAKLISSTRPDLTAEYAPDGSRVAFVSHRSGRPELWVSSADGKQPMRLAPLGRFVS